MTKKEFVIEQIKPYFKDPLLCGITDEGNCSYYTPDGKMCVAGKNLINPKDFEENTSDIYGLINIYGMEIFKEEVRDILTIEDWTSLQCAHDHIANSKNDYYKKYTLSKLQEIDDTITLKDLE